MDTATTFGAEEIENEFFKRLTTTDDKDAEELSQEDEGENRGGTSRSYDEETEETEDTSEETLEDEDSDESEETEGDEEEEEETDDSESEEDDEGEEAEGEDSKGKKPTVIESDDALVKIKVDGKEVTASLKDLKRLYGQEASLTRKSQEAAEIRKRSEESGAKYVAGLESLLQRAREQAKPYAGINFLALTKDPNVSAEELSALTEQAQSAYDNVRYLETELDGVIQQTQQRRQQMLMQQATEAIKVLSDPKTGIPGWNEQVYNEIRGFAKDNGLDSQMVDELVDPAAFKILHMAMQYAKGKKAVTTTKPKKVDKSPKRILKGTPEVTVQKAKMKPKDAAFKRLQQSGSTDDAADAFMSRWTK